MRKAVRWPSLRIAGLLKLLSLVSLLASGLGMLPVSAQITIPGPGIINTIGGRAFDSANGAAATNAELNFPSAVALDAAGNLYIADTSNDVVHKVTASTGIITTIAGNGVTGYGGDGGVATGAELFSPSGVAVDSAGNVYIADSGNCRIRKVTISTNVITTIAGSGVCGYSGDGGNALTAELDNPYDVAVDASGNIYIADYNNSRIRKVTISSGVIATVAGTGTAGYSGDNGAATSAEINLPWGVALDSSGNIYIADTYNNRIRKVTVSTGVITTIAGNGTGGYSGDGGSAINAELYFPGSVFVDKSGNVFIADSDNERIRKVTASTGVITTVSGNGSIFFSGDGGAATSAGIAGPSDVAVDSSGNIYIAEPSDGRIRKVTASTGVISTYAGNGAGGLTSGDGGQATGATFNPYAVAVDGSGNVYIDDYSNHRIRKITASTGVITTVAGTGTEGYTGDGGLATSADLAWPAGVAVDKSGNIYIADSGNSVIRKVTASTGVISTIAGNGIAGFSGSGGPATSAELSDIQGLGLDSSGNLYISDAGAAVIWKVTMSTGIITVVAGTGVSGYTGDGGAATSAELNAPTGVAIDGAGNFYIADTWNDVIRKVTTSGIISTIAGNGTCCYSGDGGAAASASLSYPQDVGVDAFGNVYIVDEGANRIRMVTAGTNIISTFAGNGIGGYGGDGGQSTDAELYGPGGIAIDTAGNVYIADSYNYRIRAVGSRGTPANPGAGYVVTVAGDGVPGYSGNGGLATAAEVNDMSGLAIDSSGNIYFADTIASVIRKVSASTGIISNVAGNGTQGFSGDGGAATSAQLYSPHDVAVDSSGNLYIADSYNNRIRKVSSSGIISTIAGNGTAGFSGDNGPAINAKLYYPASVVVDKAGNVYIGDTTNERIRKISTSGVISTYAGNGTQSFNGYGDGGPATSAEIDLGFGSLALDSSGNLYEAEYQRIREINASTGVISTVVGAGTGGYNGTFQGGLAVDSSGNVYFGAELSFVMEMKGGASTAVAGGVWTNPAGATSHGSGCSQETDSVGDGCPASEAILSGPNSLALDSTGNLYILDYGNFRVRKVGALSGISKTTPTITWPTPANIPYGTPLSSTQLDATSTQGGTFVYSPPAGTVLALGSHTLSVTFTPANSTFYNTASASVTLVVGKAPVPITWPAPASMIYGTALSTAQLDASTTVAGTFAYSPASGTLLTAGSHTLSTTFTPTDTTDYTTTTATVPITVNKALPPITWPQPADIKYGTALSSTQLNATSTVSGSFTYNPASGTVLSVGPHGLLATLTPTDTTDYTTASLVAYVTVTPATNTFDSGTITLTVNGVTAATTTYGSTSTPSTIAAGLAAGVSGSSPVTITAVDDAIYLESKTSGATTNYAYTLKTTTWNSGAFTNPSFVYPAITGALDGGQNVNAAGTTVYSYCVPGPANPYCSATSNGYDPVGNLTSYTDSSNGKALMGAWTFKYDSLNRVGLATDNQPGNPSTNYCWGYDAFGNRTIQGGSNQAFAVGSPVAPGTSPCQPASSASFTSTWASYNTTANNNQFTSTSQATGGVTYDAAGNITYDGVNQYLYDGDGRVCAVANTPVPGITTLTGYIYGADGERVAKGSITAWSCDPTLSGFKTINDYILGPSGEQVSEIGMNTATSTMVFQHTNVFAAGKLLATYDNDGIHFYFEDPLGTRRAQTDYAGVLEQTCASLPFGDSLNCSNSTEYPTEHHFTGKERDAESGNDYFGARYYGSSMGRFMSPDWSAKVEPVSYAKLDDPQSLNLYAYVRNNPLSRIDIDGHYESNCAGDDKKCNKAMTNWEKNRQKDLRSKNADVRAAAAAYGDPGEKNGVHVGFQNQKWFDAKGESTANAETNPFQSGHGKTDIEVNFKYGHGGAADIAHEGTHVIDDQRFLESWNGQTYSFNANIFHFATEVSAYSVQAAVTPTARFGPNDTRKIYDFVMSSPAYKGSDLQLVFPNSSQFPQRFDPND